MTFTVIDVIRESGVKNPEPSLSRAIGREAAAIWRGIHSNAAPAKALAEKTRGGGSHRFAQYPHEWRPIVRLVVEKHVGKQERQLPLF